MKVQGQVSIAMKVTTAAFCTFVAFAAPALAQQTRLPPIPPERYDEAQKKAAAEFEALIKRPPDGPFATLMYSPEIMPTVLAMGLYLRSKSAIGPALNELAILVTSREWSQNFEWRSHALIAVKAGIKQETVDAIADGRRPTGMSPDEEICYGFSIELHRNKRVSDETYSRVKDRFGDKGIVDLTVVNGFYTMVAMVLNTARVPVADEPKLSRFPD